MTGNRFRLRHFHLEVWNCPETIRNHTDHTAAEFVSFDMFWRQLCSCAIHGESENPGFLEMLHCSIVVWPLNRVRGVFKSHVPEISTTATATESIKQTLILIWCAVVCPCLCFTKGTSRLPRSARSVVPWKDVGFCRSLEFVLVSIVAHANLPRYNEVYGAVLERPYALCIPMSSCRWNLLARILHWHCGFTSQISYISQTFCWAVVGLPMSSRRFPWFVLRSRNVTTACSGSCGTWVKWPSWKIWKRRPASPMILMALMALWWLDDGFMTVWRCLDDFRMINWANLSNLDDWVSSKFS